MCNSIFGRSKARKAAEQTAEETKKAAESQARSDGEAARSNQIAKETAIAQSAAAEQARTMLDVPVAEVDVDLLEASRDAEIDPTTGRRRPTRASFMSSANSNTGIRI